MIVFRENRALSITCLLSCYTLEAVIVASQREKNKVPLAERTRIQAVAMDDGGCTEIVL